MYWTGGSHLREGPCRAFGVRGFDTADDLGGRPGLPTCSRAVIPPGCPNLPNGRTRCWKYSPRWLNYFNTSI